MPSLEQLQYGFDRDSRRTWRQRATTQGWDNAYAYDSLSQVIGDDRGDLNLAQSAIAGIPNNGSYWQYDETGNWHGYQTLANGETSLTQSRMHDKGNRLMEVSEAAAMRTDRAGRMLETVPGPEGDWSKGYEITWDAWSRITAVASLEEGTATPVAAYAYDGLTRRVTRYTNAEDVTWHCYYNDEWRPVEERKDSETTAALSYLWGARHRDDLMRKDRAVGGTTLNETRYILMDYFSPAAITDEEGEVTERYQFSAFGLRAILNPDFTVRSGSECAMEFGFQGQFEDIETGWMNYGYRYYLPALGRWACKDPIGEIGGMNLYASGKNNLLEGVDLFGLCPDCKKEEEEWRKASAKADTIRQEITELEQRMRNANRLRTVVICSGAVAGVCAIYGSGGTVLGGMGSTGGIGGTVGTSLTGVRAAGAVGGAVPAADLATAGVIGGGLLGAGLVKFAGHEENMKNLQDEIDAKRKELDKAEQELKEAAQAWRDCLNNLGGK